MPVDEKQLHASNLARARRFPTPVLPELMLMIMILLLIL
jgi:hypothetical protein